MPETTFFEWLAVAHPDVRLLPMQAEWARAMDIGCPLAWTGGPSSGKTYVSQLYEEYARSKPRKRDRCDACGQFLRANSVYSDRCSDCWTKADDFV